MAEILHSKGYETYKIGYSAAFLMFYYFLCHNTGPNCQRSGKGHQGKKKIPHYNECPGYGIYPEPERPELF